MGVDLNKEIKLSDLFRKRAGKASAGAEQNGTPPRERTRLFGRKPKEPKTPKAPREPKARKAKVAAKDGPALPQIPLMRAFDLMPKEVAREKKKPGRLGLAQVLVALFGLLVIAGLASGYLYMSARAATGQQEVDDLRAQLADLEVPVEAPSEGNVELASEGQARTAALGGALSSRVAWDRILREVSLVLPDDVWLTQLSASTPNAGSSSSNPAATNPSAAPNSLALVGMAEEQASVAQFLARLQTLPEFATVDLQASSYQDGGDVYDFSILATIAPQGVGS